MLHHDPSIYWFQELNGTDPLTGLHARDYAANHHQIRPAVICSVRNVGDRDIVDLQIDPTAEAVSVPPGPNPVRPPQPLPPFEFGRVVASDVRYFAIIDAWEEPQPVPMNVTLPGKTHDGTPISWSNANPKTGALIVTVILNAPAGY